MALSNIPRGFQETDPYDDEEMRLKAMLEAYRSGQSNVAQAPQYPEPNRAPAVEPMQAQAPVDQQGQLPEKPMADNYKMRMMALTSMMGESEKAERQNKMNKALGTLGQAGGNLAASIAQPVSTYSELAAGVKPQDMRGQLRESIAGPLQPSTDALKDTLSKYKQQDKMMGFMDKYEAAQKKNELRELKKEEKAEANTSKQKLKDEQYHTKEIMKGYSAESRSTTHIKKHYSDQGRIDKALYQIAAFEDGRRKLDFNAAKDLSAAATAMITGGVPPLTLIDDTTYNSLRGKVKNWEQWFRGVPTEFYTPELVQTLRSQFEDYGKTVKHKLSKHAANVWNRGIKVRQRNPDLGEAELYTWGHMLGEINPKTGFARPRPIEQPYTSIDNDFFPLTIEEINEQFRQAPGPGRAPGSIEASPPNTPPPGKELSLEEQEAAADARIKELEAEGL